MSAASLDDLIRRAVGGDREAGDELVTRYRGDLERALRRRLAQALRGRLDTEDLVQSTFLLALRDLGSFESRGEGAFLAWLLRIAEHRVATAARRHMAARRDLRREVQSVSLDARQNAGETPSVIAARGERHDLLHQAVAALPQADRDVVRLRAFENRPFVEIATWLSLPSEDAARHRYARAVRRLSDRLRTSDPECDG